MPKPPVKSVVVRFRALPKELAAWRGRSRASALTLSRWIRNRLNVQHDKVRAPLAAMDKRLLRSYLLRKAADQQETIDKAPVLSKRYGTAVDELEELEELLQLVTTP
jgi:hypothetical protein